MAGASVTVTAGTEAVRRALAHLVLAAHDLSEPMEEIGASLLASTQQRFQDEAAPDGTPWRDLSRRRQAERLRNGREPNRNKLRDKGLLYASLTYAATSADVTVGTNTVYGAIHQLGGTADMPPGPAGVPARPYLGLSDDDDREIGAILTEHLNDAWGV